MVRLARFDFAVSEKYFLDTFLYGKSSRHAQAHTNANTRTHELEGLGQNRNQLLLLRVVVVGAQALRREGGGSISQHITFNTELLLAIRLAIRIK